MVGFLKSGYSSAQKSLNSVKLSGWDENRF